MRLTGYIKLLPLKKSAIGGIQNAFLQRLNSRIRLRLPQLRLAIKDLLLEAIVDSPEYKSLDGGSLQVELGVTDPQAKLRAIVEAIADSMVVDFRPFKAASAGNVRGGLSIRLLKTDLSDVLSIPEAYEYEKTSGASWGWLSALLTKGDEIVSADYILLAKSSPKSRIGSALMVPSRKGFRVDPRFSGTVSNNWLSRTINSPSFNKEMQALIKDLIR